MTEKPVLMSASIQSNFASAVDAGRAALKLVEFAMDCQATPLPTGNERPTGEILLDDGMMVLTQQGFTFRSPAGVQFQYELGQKVSAHVPAGLNDEAHLFLWGTVFGAVAWLNDLLPLHASAVEKDGRVIAFTADSGVGKSTLAAGLADRGFAHVCDDTLVLAPSKSGLVGLPDGKPLKLWDEALPLVSASKIDPIKTVPGKNYAMAHNVCDGPAVMRDLIFLEHGDTVSLTPITGSEKLQCFPQAMYRSFLHTARDDPDYHAKLMVLAATTVRFWRLRRPLDTDAFGPTTDAIAQLLSDGGTG